MQKLTVQSFEKRDIIDITKLIQSQIEENKFKNGLCHLFTPHTIWIQALTKITLWLPARF